MLKPYDALTPDQQETAREFNPDDFRSWEYQFSGEEVQFCARQSALVSGDQTDRKETAMENISVVSTRMVKERDIPYGKRTITCTEDVHKLLLDAFDAGNLPEEHLWVIMLDVKMNVNGVQNVSTGTLNSSLVHPREVFRAAILSNSSSIILAHNHPSGSLFPSHSDMEATRRIKESGELLGIRLNDHIIITAEGYQSCM